MARMKTDSVQLDKNWTNSFVENDQKPIAFVFSWIKQFTAVISFFRVPRLTNDGRDHLLIISAKIWPKNVKHKNNIPSISFLFILVVPTKEKEFAYITGFSSNVYKTILAAEARISTTSTPRSYISAMLLALKSLLFLCSDICEP